MEIFFQLNGEIEKLHKLRKKLLANFVRKATIVKILNKTQL